jgi:hypothetical protein
MRPLTVLRPHCAPPAIRSRFEVWDAVFTNRETKRDQLLKFKNMRETESVNNKLVSQKESKSKSERRERERGMHAQVRGVSEVSR